MESLIEIEDSRADELFLIRSLWTPSLILNIYLLFILDIGPKFMENRLPFKLKKWILIYNLIQIILNLYLFLKSARIALDVHPLCEPINRDLSTKSLNAVKAFHHYHLLKVLDLLDTVFFVLRKKNNQVSTLHVYHHICVVFVSWIATRYFPGGQGVYILLMNSFVHVVMYFYYLQSSISSTTAIWWKKYITQLQLIQHFLITAIFLASLVNPNCTYPKSACLIIIPNSFTMLVLFSKFYLKQYTSRIKS